MNIIYVDLDGVLADFEEGLRRVSGGLGLEEVGDDNLWKVIRPHADGFYANLPLMPDAKTLWGYLTKNFNNVEILTAIPRRASFPTAERDKEIWVRKHFGPSVKVNFGPYAKDKQRHCVPGDILIDDSELNIPQWRAKQGIGILHTSANDSISQLETLLDRGIIDRERYQ